MRLPLAIGLIVIAASFVTGCAGTERQAAVDRIALVPAQERCIDLLRGGWKAPISDHPNLSWDPETGDTVIEFDAEQSIRINILTDQDCQVLPQVGEMIRTAISDDGAMQVQECSAAVEQYNSGEPPRRGNIVGDLDALAAHVKEWCPPGFALQLDKAEEE